MVDGERPLEGGTIVDLYQRRWHDRPTAQAFFSESPDFKHVLTWSEVWEQALGLAWGLKLQGVRPGQYVGILAAASPEWEIAQLAILINGAVCVGIDVNYPVETFSTLFERFKIEWLLLGEKASIPESLLMKRISLDDQKNWMAAHRGKTWVDPLPKGSDPAVLIFTSGTMGEPRGIVYRHEQLRLAIHSILHAIPESREVERVLCWLPLSNLFQRIINWCAVDVGAQIYFIPTPFDVMNHLARIQPQSFVGVPRFYEKVRKGIEDRIRSAGIPARLLFALGLYVGGQRSKALQQGRRPGPLWRGLYALFDRLILRRVRGVFGPQIRFLISGSAPLRTEDAVFFHSLGLQVLEAYGVSENVIPIAINRVQEFRFGSVGKPLIPDSVKISAGGEVLVKGRGVFSGYEGETVDVFENGFYKTGDLGEFDAKGFLYIKGRQGDFFKTSTGRRIPTLDIQSKVKEIPWVDLAAPLGEARKAPVVLVSLDFPGLAQHMGITLQDLWDSTGGHLTPRVLEQIKTDLLERLTSIPRSYRPAGILLLARRLSLKEKEVTANLKLRRRFLEKKFSNDLDQIFELIDKKPILPPVLQIQAVDTLPSLPMPPWHRGWKTLQLAVRVLGVSLKQWVLGGHSVEVNEQLGIILKEGLGSFKGPLLKIGQMMGYTAQELPANLRAQLRELLHNSPPVNPELIRSVVESEFKKPIPLIFSEWNDVPLATGSIGQIHLAKLPDGTDVAVKVKLPGLDRIAQSDLKMLLLAIPLLKLIWKLGNLYEHYEELKRLIMAECDLQQEARNLARFQELFKDDPRVIIPTVYPHLCSSQVLTCEYIPGLNFDEFLSKSTQAERDRAAAIIWEFSTRSVNRFHVFNADPHPGNYIFKNDQVAFIDFGFCRTWDASLIDTWKMQSIAGCKNDVEGFARASKQMGIYRNGTPLDYSALMHTYHGSTYRAWIRDEPFQFTPDFMQQQLKTFYTSLTQPDIHLPSEFLAIIRLFWGMSAVMAELQANINFHRITMPYIEELSSEQNTTRKAQI